jgi:hypothetical protein
MNLTPRIDNLDKNYIINGNFDNWQRATSHTANGLGSVDRFKIANNFSGVTTMSQNADVPNSNSIYSLNQQITTPSAISSTEWVGLTHSFEGTLTKGLANKDLTLGFWFKSSHAGKHSGFFIRADNVRRYVFEFDYDVADTWQYVPINFTLDLQSFISTNALNFYFGLNMAVGSTYQRAAGTWADSNEFGATGSLDLSNISGAYIRLSQMQLVENTGQALDGSTFSYAGGDVTKDFQLCQRYYQTIGGGWRPHVMYVQTPTTAYGTIYTPVELRTNPTFESPTTNIVSGTLGDIREVNNASGGTFNTTNYTVNIGKIYSNAVSIGVTVASASNFSAYGPAVLRITSGVLIAFNAEL